MNFGMLKNMVENLVSSYTCPFCQSKDMDEQNIDIVGAAGNTVNIDMHCPSCNKHFMAKTEVVQMELWKFSPEKLEKIKNSLSALKWKMGGDLSIETIWSDFDSTRAEDVIKDEEILNLHKNLQQNSLSAEDLFSQD